jgi:hypothetical protein
VGTPEQGHAVRRIYPGADGGTVIGAAVRASSVVYADVQVDVNRERRVRHVTWQ